MHVTLLSRVIQSKVRFGPCQMFVKQVSEKRAVNGSLALRALDIKALRQLVFMWEKMASLSGILKGGSIKVDHGLLDQVRCERWGPTRPSKKYPLTFWIPQLGNVLSRASVFAKMPFTILKLEHLPRLVAVTMGYARRRPKKFHLLTQIRRMSAQLVW